MKLFSRIHMYLKTVIKELYMIWVIFCFPLFSIFKSVYGKLNYVINFFLDNFIWYMVFTYFILFIWTCWQYMTSEMRLFVQSNDNQSKTDIFLFWNGKYTATPRTRTSFLSIKSKKNRHIYHENILCVLTSIQCFL